MTLGIWLARLPGLLAGPPKELVPLPRLCEILVAAYAERTTQLARGSLPLHDTAFDAVVTQCAVHWPGSSETGGPVLLTRSPHLLREGVILLRQTFEACTGLESQGIRVGET